MKAKNMVKQLDKLVSKRVTVKEAPITAEWRSFSKKEKKDLLARTDKNLKQLMEKVVNAILDSVNGRINDTYLMYSHVNGLVITMSEREAQVDFDFANVKMSVSPKGNPSSEKVTVTFDMSANVKVVCSVCRALDAAGITFDIHTAARLFDGEKPDEPKYGIKAVRGFAEQLLALAAKVEKGRSKSKRAVQ